jgi:hypothetical protein
MSKNKKNKKPFYQTLWSPVESKPKRPPFVPPTHAKISKKLHDTLLSISDLLRGGDAKFFILGKDENDVIRDVIDIPWPIEQVRTCSTPGYDTEGLTRAYLELKEKDLTFAGYYVAGLGRFTTWHNKSSYALHDAYDRQLFLKKQYNPEDPTWAPELVGGYSEQVDWLARDSWKDAQRLHPVTIDIVA